MKSQKSKNEVLFINTEIYISDEASNYIKSLKNVIYHKYINNEKMIEVIRQTKFKRCILLTSSSIIKTSNILELFPNKLFIAPYSTLKSVRKYKNICTMINKKYFFVIIAKISGNKYIKRRIIIDRL